MFYHLPAGAIHADYSDIHIHGNSYFGHNLAQSGRGGENKRYDAVCGTYGLVLDTQLPSS